MVRIVSRGCVRCGGGDRHAGTGRIHNPNEPWWKFWRTFLCPSCQGSGELLPCGLRPVPNSNRVTIIHMSCSEQHFAVVDVDGDQIGKIPISQEIAQSQEFFDGLRAVVRTCVAMKGG